MLRPVIVMTCAVASAVLAGLGLMKLDDHAAAPVATAQRAPTTPSDTTQTTEDSHVTAIPKGQDGHFWANATINDKAVRFLVDTGATVVVLTEADAQRLGIDKASLSYNRKVITAM